MAGSGCAAGGGTLLAGTTGEDEAALTAGTRTSGETLLLLAGTDAGEGNCEPTASLPEEGGVLNAEKKPPLFLSFAIIVRYKFDMQHIPRIPTS